MAVYTETINMDGNLGAEAKKASDQVAILEKGLKSAEAALVRASALGDQKGMSNAVAKIDGFKGAIDSVPPSLLAVNKDASAMGASLAKAGAMGASAAAAIATAALAAAAAMGGLVLAGIHLALEMADAKGDLILLFDTLLDGVGTGEEAIAMLDRLGDATGQTREELGKLAQGFAPLATSTAHLEALTLAAVSASAMAKGGGEAFEQMYKKIALAAETGQALKVPLKGLGSLASMGLKVDDVAKKMGMSAEALGKQLAAGSVDAKKFGDAMTSALIDKGAGPVADAAMDLGNLWKKAKESVGKFFEDIDVGPFIKEVKGLFGILDQSTASGQALKAGIGGFFTEVFALMTKLVPMVKHFFLDLIIYGLQAYLAIKPIAAAIQAFAESEEGIAAIQMLKDGLLGAAIAAGIVIAAIAAVGVTIAATVAIVLGAFAALGMALTLAYQQLLTWGMSATVAAQNFISGLVGGITAGAAQVVGAVKGLASQATAAFKGALGIASPSKVMMEMGGHMGSGVALGLDATAGDVAASSTGVAVSAVEAAGAVPTGGGPAAGGGGGVNVTIEAGAIVIQGGASASVVELTEQAVALIFERIASQQGLMA